MKTRTLSVELTAEEYADLEEFVHRHPDKAKDPAAALRQMAGIGMYRAMKKKVDPKRRKAPANTENLLLQDMGIPSYYPCALQEALKASGRTYDDFIEEVLVDAAGRAQRAVDRGNFETHRTRDGRKGIRVWSREIEEFQRKFPGVEPHAEIEAKKIEVPKRVTEAV